MRVDQFDFELPEDAIALRPARPRDAARMLHVDAKGGLHDRGVKDLPRLLRAGDVLVVNDTRVIPAALNGVRRARNPDGADVAVEVNLHARTDEWTWRAFARPGKRLRVGDTIEFSAGVRASISAKGAAGELTLAFAGAGDGLDDAIAEAGAPPLPPYIARKRAVDAADEADYQTVYAQSGASVAAPTAGLHFTEQLLATLEAAGIEIVRIRLDVGAGTFLPVAAETTDQHRMHSEHCVVSADAATAINVAKANGGRIVAVGTTSLRTLESVVDMKGQVKATARDTDIFITPGYRFRAVDLLLTNFHLPRSTLFMLVSAFSGLDAMQRAYSHAIGFGYRFYSYGDACLLERA